MGLHEFIASGGADKPDASAHLTYPPTVSLECGLWGGTSGPLFFSHIFYQHLGKS